MELPKTIKEYINPTLGFFIHMHYIEIIQMQNVKLTPEQFDILYYANYGDKNPAPIVTKTLSLPPTEEELIKLASIVESFYFNKWEKLNRVLNTLYDPIANYSDELVEVIDETIGSFRNEILSTDGTRNVTTEKNMLRTDNLAEFDELTSEKTSENSVDNSIYGFNSTTSSPSDESSNNASETASTTNTISNTGTQNNAIDGTDEIVDHKGSDNEITTSDTHQRNRTSSHSGNIGNLTTQQLLTQEIELANWNFINAILTDVNDFLTIPIYLR